MANKFMVVPKKNKYHVTHQVASGQFTMCGQYVLAGDTTTTRRPLMTMCSRCSNSIRKAKRDADKTYTFAMRQ